jgi:uncharacterized integral membrane protein
MADETPAPIEESSGGLNFRLVLGAIAAAGLALFIFQNTDDARVNFLWMDGEIPLFLLLLITVVLTLVLAMVVTWMLRRREGR